MPESWPREFQHRVRFWLLLGVALIFAACISNDPLKLIEDVELALDETVVTADAVEVSAETPCTPVCEGRECGSDGCGGSCGYCPAPENLCMKAGCSADHLCAESPDDGSACDDGLWCTFDDECNDGVCIGQKDPDDCFIDGACYQNGAVKPGEGCLECSPALALGSWSDVPDGCPCGPGAVCWGGLCCTIACEGKECGDDGCGGNCGQCLGAHECVAGACIYVPGCGNGFVDLELGEECDDGNLDPGDLCDEGCVVEPMSANPGDIIFTEIMKDPKEVEDIYGEWLELRNMTSQPIDLNAWTLEDLDSDWHRIYQPGGVVVPPNSYAILGANADVEANGGLVPDYAYDNDEFWLANGADEVVLKSGDTMIDQVALDDGETFPDQAGRALSLEPAAHDASSNDLGVNWCNAYSVYGNGDYGTPGTANPTCQICGNGICEGEEDCSTCAADCGECAGECDPPCDPELEVCVQATTGGWVCSAKMVSIPAGNFWMGCNNCPESAVNDTNCNSSEDPYHEVSLDSYEIDRTEVTADQYAACETADGCAPAGTDASECTCHEEGMGDHPINCVDWSQAEAYCLWVGKALCTEAQWEKGARGGCEKNGGPSNCEAQSRKYPWGNDTATCDLAVKYSCAADTQHVCSRSPAGDSPYGLCDMAGNVGEWTADWYLEDYYCDGEAASGDEYCAECGSWPGFPAAWSNPDGPGTGLFRSDRGGSFGTTVYLRVSSRHPRYPPDISGNLGFRCCRSE